MNMFYTVIFAFAAVWSLMIVKMLGVYDISRNWWFISVGAILLFLGNLWQTILDIFGISSPIQTIAFMAPAAALLLAGIFMETTYWRARTKAEIDQSRELDEIFDKMIGLRRPDITGESKEKLKKYLRRRAPGFSLTVVMSAIDEWEKS
ncbi:MAG: hypothetical protein ACE5KU_00765 [Nitrososphaerales archaeon]